MINRLPNIPVVGLVMVLLLPAQPGWAQSVALASNGRQTSSQTRPATSRQLKDVLAELKSRYKAEIMFELRAVEGLSVNANVANPQATLEENLDAILRPLGLRYKKVNGSSYLVFAEKKARKSSAVESSSLKMVQPSGATDTDAGLSDPDGRMEASVGKPAALVAAERTITGTVKGETDESLPGVSVVVKNSTRGTTTDANGNFRINVEEGDVTLIFSFVGYANQEVAVGNRTNLEVKLLPDLKSLDEVVVVGYGTQKKVTSTGSVVSVKGAEVVQAPVTNVSNALAGRLAGVTAIQRSGEPGRDGATIRIRGVNTLGDNSALVVVDGIPGRSLDRIDANSIETITVLKDASAAIYGSQAANGVILITTKRGQAGKPQISLNLNQGFNQPTRVPRMADAVGYATLLNEIDGYRNQKPRYTPEQIQKFGNGSDPWSYPNTDWFGAVLKPWSAQNNANLSLSGGGDNMRYFLSLGSKSQDGYYYNSGTKYNQYDFRSNIDGKISKNVNIRFDVYGREEDRHFPVRSAGSIFRMLMRGKPIYPAYWPNGTPGPDLEYGDNPAVVSTDATGYDRDKLYVLNSNLRLEVKVPGVEGLSFVGNASFDKTFRFRKRFETPWYLYSWDGKSYDQNNVPILARGKKGFDDARLTQWSEDNQNILLNGLLNYERTFGPHGMKVMAGMETRQGRGEEFSAYRRYFISGALDQLFAGGDKDKNNGGSAYQNARLNYFGRVNYDYNQKILAEFVWRYDGSYIFPQEGRFGFFPGVSLGYRLSEEDFWKNSVPFVENLKLRASWGQTGNDRIAEWQYLSSYAFNDNGYSYIFGIDQQNKLLRETRIPNRNVTWEIANQANVGLEATLFRNRMTVEFDYFDNRRSQILWQRNASVPASTGLTLPRENIGKVKNRGVDFSVGFRDQFRKLRYSAGVNGSYARNTITFWDESPGRPEWQQSTGKPIPSNPARPDDDLYYESLGVFRDQAAVDAYPHWSGARPGDVIYRDVDGDGKITGSDRVRNAKSNVPRLTGGVNLGLGYGAFDLAVLFQGAAGAIRYLSTESGEIGNFLQDFYLNRWTPEHPDASQPRTFNSNAEYWRNNNSTMFIRNTDYIRLKNLEFGYTLAPSIAQKLGIGKLRLYVSGYNLLTFSPGLKDFDPESDLDNGQGYPVQRVVNGGITLTF